MAVAFDRSATSPCYMKQISTWHSRGLFWSEDAGAPKGPSGKGLGAKENEKVGAYSMRLKNFLVAEQLQWRKVFGLLALLVLATIAGAQQQKSPPAKAGVISGSVFLITKSGDLKPARMAHLVLLCTSQTGTSDDASAVGVVWLSNIGKAMGEYDHELAAQREHPEGVGVWLPRHRYFAGDRILVNGYVYSMDGFTAVSGDTMPEFDPQVHSVTKEVPCTGPSDPRNRYPRNPCGFVDQSEMFRGGWYNLGKASDISTESEVRSPKAEQMCIKRLSLYGETLKQTLEWAHSANKLSQAIAFDADETGMFNVDVPQPGNYMVVARGHAGFNDAFWQAGVPDRIVVNAGANTAVKLSSPEVACVVTQ